MSVMRAVLGAAEHRTGGRPLQVEIGAAAQEDWPGAPRDGRLPAVSMRALRSVTTLVALFLAVASGGEPGAARAESPRKVIGYYADWTAARYPLADIPAGKLTHVNYAFGKIGPDNRLTWNAAVATERVYPGDCADPGCSHGLFNQITLLKQKHPHLKF